MIDLAPSNKRGLVLKSPVMFAAGFGGYSDEYGALVDLTRLGALVTVPTTPRRRLSPRSQRIIEMNAGFLLARGGTNPGLSAAVASHQRTWHQLGLPVIFSLAAESVNQWGDIARRLDKVGAVAGVELEIEEEMSAAEAIRPVRQLSELPILAKIPIARAGEFSMECVTAGANALVIGLPPRADSYKEGAVWKGRWYGAGLAPLALRAVRKVNEQHTGVPLVACGGIHSTQTAREFLAAGATTVQLDSVLFLNPGLANQIIAELQGSSPQNQL